jgi:hypothetical protein
MKRRQKRRGLPLGATDPSHLYAVEDDFGIVFIIAWDTLAEASAAKQAIQNEYNEYHQTDCVLSLRQATEREIDHAQEINCFGELPHRPIGRWAQQPDPIKWIRRIVNRERQSDSD